MFYIIFFVFQISAFQNKDVFNEKAVGMNVLQKGYVMPATNQSDTFPNFKLPDQKNKYINMYEIKPKSYMLISIWNSNCASCENEMRKFGLLYNKYQKSITFISISNDTDKKEWEKSIARNNLKSINLFDTKKVVAKGLALKEEPAFILLDQNHIILEKFYSIIPLEKRLNEYYFINDGLRVRNRPDK